MSTFYTVATLQIKKFSNTKVSLRYEPKHTVTCYFPVKTRVIYHPIKLEINLEPFFHQILRMNENFST